ncbi:hypothetical protein CFC21_084548, partial [Triticum aestivum]
GHRQPVQRGGGGRRQRGEHEGAALGARQPAPLPRRRARRAPRPAAARHRRRPQPRPHPLRRPQCGGGAGVHAGHRVAPAANHGCHPGAMFLGSVSNYCINSVGCPVVVIKGT